MARYANGRVFFDGGEDYATVAELDAAGEAVDLLTPGICVFPFDGKTFQSDGMNQGPVDPAVQAQLTVLESRKGIFLPGIVAARTGA